MTSMDLTWRNGDFVDMSLEDRIDNADDRFKKRIREYRGRTMQSQYTDIVLGSVKVRARFVGEGTFIVFLITPKRNDLNNAF